MAQAPRDNNRVPSVLAKDTVSNGAIPVSGLALGSVEALVMALVDGSGNQITSFGGGTQYADGAARGTATGTLGMVDDGTLIQSAKGDSDGTQQVSLTKVGGTAVALGQVAMASSIPVVLASNQASIPVAATLTAETTKVIGTINIAASQTVGLVAGTALVGKVGLDQTTPGTTNAVSIAQIGATTVLNGGVAGSLAIGGANATNVAITTNPVNNGAQGVSSENSAVTTGRMVQLVADLVGKLIVLPYANPENFVSGAITSAMTGTTSTSLIASPGGSLRNYITQITVSNSHATVGTDIIIQDGSGGTTLYTIPAAAVYGGAVVTFPTPLRQPTTATAIFCANVTTGASTKVSASGYKGL